MKALAIEAVEESKLDVKVYEGRVCTGDQFISTNEQKAAITSSFGGMCCEMEGGAIAQACYLNNIPFVIIRAISDKSDGSENMEYETFKAIVAKDSATIVRYMVGKL